MIPIYERGYRPKPNERDAVAVWIYHDLDRHMRLARPQIAHEMFWGVPIGPTLSMVHPPKLSGIKALVG